VDSRDQQWLDLDADETEHVIVDFAKQYDSGAGDERQKY